MLFAIDDLRTYSEDYQASGDTTVKYQDLLVSTLTMSLLHSVLFSFPLLMDYYPVSRVYKESHHMLGYHISLFNCSRIWQLAQEKSPAHGIAEECAD